MIGTLARKSLRARIGRSIFIGLTILAGVAFVAGSFVLADSLKGTFDNLINGLTENVDLEVRAELTVDDLNAARDPIPSSLIEQVAAVPGIEITEGGLARYAQMYDPDGELVTTQGAPTLGVSWVAENQLSAIEMRDGRAPNGIGEVVIDKATADRVGFEVGDDVTILFGTGPRQFEIVGLIGLGDADGFVGATTSVFDFETAVTVLDAGDTVDAIDIGLADGADIETVRAAIEEILPARIEVVTGEELAQETKDQVGELITVFGTGLLVFAMVTAFVAAFVINNIYGITIGQRLRELALLRAIGANGKQVRRLVLLEALAVAVIATIIGIFGGYLVAKGIIAAFNAAGGGFPSTRLLMKPRTVIVASIVGIGITIASVLLPAYRASKIPPVAAMHPELGFGALSASRRLIGGMVATSIGVASFLIGLFVRPGGGAGLALFAGGGALLTFLGVTSLSTTVARPVSRLLGAPIQRLFGTPGKIARDNAARSPRRTARTASALMIGVALISAAAVFASSLRDTFGRILDRAITADYIIWDDESFQPLPPQAADLLAEIPELSAVSPFRSIQGDVGDDIGGDTVMLTAINPVAFPDLVDIEVTEGGYDGLVEQDGLMLYRSAAEDRGFEIGDDIDIVWQNGVESSLTVAGLFDDNALDAGWLISIDTLESVSSQAPNDQLLLAKLADGVSYEEATPAIEAALIDFPQANVQTDSEFRQAQEAQINQLLALITILLLVAIAFSFLGIAITLALSVFERTREIGLLRAVGMNRRQLRRAVRWEAVIVALFGVIVGVVVGSLFGVALSYAVPNNVIDGITYPIGTIVIVFVVAVIAAVLAALYPAYKASRMNVLDAISTE
jgi:putative ABC transport system permease protein